MNEKMRNEVYESYCKRHINYNMTFDINMSQSDIKDYCIITELKYLLKQKKISECEHSYSSPKIEYSMYGRRLNLVCNLCGHNCNYEIK